MNAKAIRRSLVMSVISLLLCVSMLVGTTYAWFTDSVTSGRNTIQSGNLDVVLEYWNGTEYKEVDAETKLFNDAALWEPGYTEVAYLKVTNAGSLALKYQLAVNVYNEVTGKTKDNADITLSEHLQFKVVESETDLAGTYSRDTAKNADAAATKLQNYTGTSKALEPRNAEGTNDYTDYVALIIYMPESVGNEANHNGTDVPKIEMGVSLFATQQTYESDSFDNQYDAGADYPETADVWDGTVDTAWYNDTDTTFALSTAEEFAGFAKLVNEGNKFSKKTIELESNLDYNGEEWTPIKNFAGTLNGKGHFVRNFEIDAMAGNAGFFDVLEWATVEDLTLADVTVTVGNYRFGTLARSINQSNIDNVTVKNVTVTTTGSEAFVAGLFAHGTVNSNMEVNNCTVENLTVNAKNGATIIAGITDFVQKNGTEAEGTNVLENLHVKNFKVIAYDTDGYCNIGGLVGQTQSVWQNPRFNNCSVSGLDVVATGMVNVGGFMCAPGSYTYAEDCTVEGKIDVSGVTSADNHAGGFFGDYGWGDNDGKGDHKVMNCSANVDITTKVATAGGFVGSGTNSEGKNKNITLTDCKANGTVTCVEGGTAVIGGFVGQTDRGIYINCSAAQNPFIGKVLDGYTRVDDGNGTLTVEAK